MAISPARLQVNRATGRRATGPRTAQGKAASSRNALKHGLLSRQPLLADEDPAEYDALAVALFVQLSPAPGVEELIVHDVAGLVWRLRRLQRVETALYAVGSSAPVLEALRRSGETDAAVGVAFSTQAATFAVLSRYETAMVGRLRRALADLEHLQEARQTTATTLVVIDGDR